MMRMLEALRSDMDRMMKESQGRGVDLRPPHVHVESSEVTMRSVAQLQDVVEVLRPRKVLPTDVLAGLAETSFASMARAVLDCYDFPWEHESGNLTLAVTPFVTDVPERRALLRYSQALLLRLNGDRVAVREQKGSLITGPMGCGKSTLTLLLALAVGALSPRSVVIHFDCSANMSHLFFSHIVAAGLIKAGLVTTEEVAALPLSMAHLRVLAQRRGDVIVFIDETQRMFRPENERVRFPSRETTRIEELYSDLRTMEAVWPRSFFSGSAVSLKHLFYKSGVASPSAYKSRMTDHLNSTKLTHAALQRLVSSASIVPIVADFEREFQLSLRAKSDPDLERDPTTGLPLLGSEKNRSWLRATVGDLSDTTAPDTLESRDRARATEYLRRHIAPEVLDDPMLFFGALLFSRGVPRSLKNLMALGPEEAGLDASDFLVPRRVRRLWLQMASFLVEHPRPGVRRDLVHALRSMARMDFPSEGSGSPGDLALLKIDIRTFLTLVPEAQTSFPSTEELEMLSDRGLIVWDEVAGTISFASVADFALSRISVLVRPDQLALASLLFNECGTEHEYLAVRSLKHAMEHRAAEPAVSRTLARIGVCAVSANDPSDQELNVLWRPHPVTFPSVSETELRLHGLPLPLRDGSMSEDAYQRALRGAAASIRDPRFRGRVSLPVLLMETARARCKAAMDAAASGALRLDLDELRRRRASFEVAADPLGGHEEESLLTDFAAARADDVVRTVHEAFGLEPGSQRSPVLLKPSPDSFKADWVLVCPDGSVSLLQMKHGASEISEREAVLDAAASVKVLRAWLGHRGVPSWTTTPVRGVVWCVRPTAESRWKDQPLAEGRIAEAVGVEWLDKRAIAPVWLAEVVQVLFHAKKEQDWGVASERKRAGVRTRTAAVLARLLREAAETDPGLATSATRKSTRSV